MSLATLAGATRGRPAFRRRQARDLMGLPKTLAAIGELDVRLATTKAEIRRAQKLRYRVFFEEGGAKADPTARLIRRDVCRFDRVCDHLIVVDNSVRADRRQADGRRRLPAAARRGRGGEFRLLQRRRIRRRFARSRVIPASGCSNSAAPASRPPIAPTSARSN